jgi:PRTRC genetic system protein E
MKFFSEIKEIVEKQGLTLRVSAKSDILSVMVLPDKSVENMPPLIISGSADELDANFLNKLNTYSGLAKEYSDNLEQIKQDLEKARAKIAEKAKGKTDDKAEKTSKSEKVEKPKEVKFDAKKQAAIMVILKRVDTQTDEDVIEFLRKQAVTKCTELKFEEFLPKVAEHVEAALTKLKGTSTPAAVQPEPEPEPQEVAKPIGDEVPPPTKEEPTLEADAENNEALDETEDDSNDEAEAEEEEDLY